MAAPPSPMTAFVVEEVFSPIPCFLVWHREVPEVMLCVSPHEDGTLPELTQLMCLAAVLWAASSRSVTVEHLIDFFRRVAGNSHCSGFIMCPQGH